MQFYFSGIGGRQEYEMLAEARVSKILVDHLDLKHVPAPRRIDMLDSGAYRAFKAGAEIRVDDYLKTVGEAGGRADLIVAPDVIGDAQKSFDNWHRVRKFIARDKLVPVWEWNSPEIFLKKYLLESEVVGIGGLARIMRAGDKTRAELKLRDETVAGLLALCEQFPERFHIFGLNYLKGIETLAPFARSGDSSNWLRGGRYGFIIFKHTKNGHLTQAPAKCVPQYKDLDRAGRCIASARGVEDFINRV